MKKLIAIILVSAMLTSCVTRQPWEQTKKKGYGCENTKYTGGF